MIEQTTPSHSDIEQLVVGNEDFTKIEKELGRFCIFEAMDVVRGEVRLGNLLATFLDPVAAHGYGTKILRAFLMEAVRAGLSAGAPVGRLSPLDVYLSTLDDTKVYREWRRIDIVLVIEQINLAIAIELKIGSKQRPNQLNDYRQTLENEFCGEGWKKLYIFLTVDPEDPADKVWIPLRYSSLVPALAKVEAPAADPGALAAFTAFLAMLRRHHVTDDTLEEIARRLWSSHRAALTYLADRRPDGLRGVFTNLFEQVTDVAQQLDGDGVTFIADKSVPADLRFGCRLWDSLPGFTQGTDWVPSGRMILFELKRHGDSAYGEIYLGPGPQAIRDRIVQALKSMRHRKDLKPGTEWMCIAKKRLYTAPSNDDLDLGEIKKKIIKDFGIFCRDSFRTIDGPLRSALQ